MKIIVTGCCGRMGKILCELCAQGYAGAELAAGIDIYSDGETDGQYKTLAEFTGEADCVVDFSFHGATGELLQQCIERGLPVIVATTGHTESEKAAIQAASAQIPVFYSANMSLGIAVLADLARRAAAMFPEADIEIVEAHHNRKLDAPSGTALLLADAIKQARPEAVCKVGRSGHAKRTQEEIGIHSLRLGNETGMHEILIATGSETLTLKHEAETPVLFGHGALKAAAWICGKGPGLYSMKDLLA